MSDSERKIIEQAKKLAALYVQHHQPDDWQQQVNVELGKLAVLVAQAEPNAR